MRLTLLNEKDATLGDGVVSEVVEEWLRQNDIKYVHNPSSVDTVSKCQGVVIGGGGLLHDTQRLSYFSSIVNHAKSLNLKVACIGLGWYVMKSDSRLLWGEILRYAGLVTARNYVSKAIAISLCGNLEKEVFVYPDLGFRANLGDPVVGESDTIAIIPRPEVEVDFMGLAKALQPKFKLISIPFSYGGYDYYVKMAKESGMTICKPTEWLAPFKRSGYILSYRYHGAVFAILLGKPLLQFDDRDFKTNALLREMQYPFSFTKNDGSTQISEKIKALVDNTDVARKKVLGLRDRLRPESEKHLIKLKEYFEV